jgi:hypothetical protein
MTSNFAGRVTLKSDVISNQFCSSSCPVDGLLLIYAYGLWPISSEMKISHVDQNGVALNRVFQKESAHFSVV